MTRRSFEALDGMRGVAALAVVAFHARGLFGRQLAPSGYLAVDLFFALSGYVLAHAYDGRGLGLRDFMRLRLVRLWPIYALGLGFGLLQALALVMAGKAGPASAIFATAALNGLYLPSHLYGGGDLFPLDPPAWSLLFELLANVVFCTVVFRKQPLLLALTAAAGALLLFVDASRGSLTGGAQWTEADVALARVGWSFSIGVLLRRHVPQPRLPKGELPVVLLLVCVAGLLLVDPGPWRVAYDAIFALIASPAIIWLGSGAKPSGRSSRVCLALGAASYPIYAVHKPIVDIASAVAHRIPAPVAISGGLLLASMLPLGLALDRWFDQPVRKWLGRRAGLRSAAAAA